MSPHRQSLEPIYEAFLDAFTLESLERLLALKLGRELYIYVGPGSKTDVVFQLLEAARREGFLNDLVAAAREFVPGNAKLAALAAPPRAAAPKPAGQTRYFNQSELYEIRDLLVEAGFGQNDRQDLLFVSMNARYVATLPADRTPDVRLLKVLNALNQTPALTDGELPFRTLLTNAVESAKPLPVSARIEGFLDRLPGS